MLSSCLRIARACALISALVITGDIGWKKTAGAAGAGARDIISFVIWPSENDKKMAAVFGWFGALAIQAVVGIVIGSIVKQQSGGSSGGGGGGGGPNDPNFKEWAKTGAHAYDGNEVKKHGEHVS
jgi:hypothetical protein